MPTVTHVSPMFFGAGGYWGGGERYALELARAMAPHVRTRLVSFAPRARRMRAGPLEIRLLPRRARYRDEDLNPISELLPFELATARVVHVHQPRSVVGDQCLVGGRLLNRPVFATDHNGRGHNFGERLGLYRWLTGLLAVSGHHAASVAAVLRAPARVVYGGVDVGRFTPGDGTERRRGVVFVGRLLHFKGVDVLIEAMDPDVPLDIIGPAYDAGYRALLERLAVGKTVTFHDPPAGDGVARGYRAARVAAVPSFRQSPHGFHTLGEPFALATLEALASGTPVVASDEGGTREVIEDGVNGFLVPPGDPVALRERIGELLADDRLWRRMSDAAVETVRSRFTWDHVARRCLDGYRELGNAAGNYI